MNNHSPLAVKFTDENYLTKAEVGKQLHMLTFDSYWEEVTSYREEHRLVLPFRTISGSAYYFTATEAILAKLDLFEKHLNQFASRATNLAMEQSKETKTALFFPILKQISELEKSNTKELTIKVILSGAEADTNENHSPVRLYLQTLNYYLDRSADRPDSSFLGSALSRLYGNDDLMEFYRFKDFDNRVARLAYVLNPDYPYAPYQEIETLMDPFYDWLSTDTNLPPFAHAIIALFYMDYVKPFWERNSSMAALLAKDAYAWATKEKSNGIFYAPFELLLNPDFAESDAYRETKRTCDATYLVLEALNRFGPLLDNANRSLDAMRIKPYQDDFHQLSPEEERLAERKFSEPKQMTLPLDNVTPIVTPESKVEVSPSQKPAEPSSLSSSPSTPLPVSTPLQAENEPVAPLSSPTVSSVNTVPVLSSIEPVTPISGEELTKSEIKDYVRYLLETNPSLNKKQASFYASHCTSGRYYTIQQYKAFTKCVYETARTSMDKLAEEGYYKKLQFKNKFVYTPSGKENKHS
ncbi:MAG: hypothetical protein PUC66_01885 [Erysipelotrichaceae bacterium]|nr:hypothetical protein [Erysipelotrichaceae bacterium]